MAWALWRSYYLWRLPRLEKRLRVATDWTVDLLFGRDISQIKTHVNPRPSLGHTPQHVPNDPATTKERAPVN